MTAESDFFLPVLLDVCFILTLFFFIADTWLPAVIRGSLFL